MKRLGCLVLASLLCAGTATRGNAQTSYPMLMSLKPVAAQTGQTSEHTITSRYGMQGAFDVLVTGEGVTGEVVLPESKPDSKAKPTPLQKLKVRFTIAPDALPGVRDFRIATPQGVSTLGQLVVTREVVVSETAKNDTQEQATETPVPATVCGTIERAEDVDYFRFRVEEGQSLSFHVRSMRLQDKIHDLQKHVDPILTLRNAAGVTLAASDNFFFGDPFIAHHFDKAGEYLLELRDVRYQGNAYWEYAIEISDRPFVTNAYPLAVSPGGETEVEVAGFHLGDDAKTRVMVPADAPQGDWRVPLTLNGSSSNPAPFVVSPLPLVQETATDNNQAESAQEVSVPCGINGRIESDADVDCFRFQAKKGEKFSFQVRARRHQSALDSHLRILNDQGKQLALNDDLRLGKRNFADSWLENWTAPADGSYVVEVRDLHLRGGTPFVYCLEVTRSEPYFELYVDTDKTQLTPGTNGVIFVRTVRKNGFTGAIQLHVDELPEGVTAECGRILDGKGQDGCIILTAAKDASMAVSNVRIRGTAAPPSMEDSGDPQEGQGSKAESSDQQVSEPCEAVALPYQETYQPGGGRGHWPVQMHTVSVAAPSDILQVTLSADEVVLTPGESQRVEVKIQRTEGFTKNVTLDVIYKHLNSVYGNSLPEGVTLDGGNSKTLLTNGASEGHITLKAASTAPAVKRQQAVVMANVSLNFVMKATYSSSPLWVTVKPQP